MQELTTLGIFWRYLIIQHRNSLDFAEVFLNGFDLIQLVSLVRDHYCNVLGFIKMCVFTGAARFLETLLPSAAEQSSDILAIEDPSLGRLAIEGPPSLPSENDHQQTNTSPS